MQSVEPFADFGMFAKSTKDAVRVSYSSSGLLTLVCLYFQLLTCCNVNFQFRMQD